MKEKKAVKEIAFQCKILLTLIIYDSLLKYKTYFIEPNIYSAFYIPHDEQVNKSTLSFSKSPSKQDPIVALYIQFVFVVSRSKEDFKTLYTLAQYDHCGWPSTLVEGFMVFLNMRSFS